jgi:hypothetical protein
MELEMDFRLLASGILTGDKDLRLSGNIPAGPDRILFPEEL